MLGIISETLLESVNFKKHQTQGMTPEENMAKCLAKLSQMLSMDLSIKVDLEQLPEEYQQSYKELWQR